MVHGDKWKYYSGNNHSEKQTMYFVQRTTVSSHLRLLKNLVKFKRALHTRTTGAVPRVATGTPALRWPLRGPIVAFSGGSEKRENELEVLLGTYERN